MIDGALRDVLSEPFFSNTLCGHEGWVWSVLQERADMIDDQELRRSYLENVPYHREIVSEYSGLSRDEGDADELC